jgi:hypothetical protein
MRRKTDTFSDFSAARRRMWNWWSNTPIGSAIGAAPKRRGRQSVHDGQPKAQLAKRSPRCRKYYSLAIWAGEEWKIPAPETCDAIKNATTTAGRLISLRT